MSLFSLEVRPGLVLGLCEARHAAMIYAAIDRNRKSLEEWLPWVALTQSAGDVRAFLVRAHHQFAAGDGFHSGIFDGEVLAGFIGLHPIDWPNERVELGYWLDRDHRGKGIMTEACRRVVRYCFEDYGLHRVEIRCGTENRASAAVAERLGFQYEGTLREAQSVGGRRVDQRVYAALRAEPRTRGI